MKEPPAIRRFYWILPPWGGSEGSHNLEWADRIFPLLNHLAEIYLIGEDPEAEEEILEPFLQRLEEHLKHWEFCRIHLRPVHPVGRDRADVLEGFYNRLSRRGGAFHREALEHQVVSRWMVMPVLRAGEGDLVDGAFRLGRRLQRHMILSSYLLPLSPELRPRLQSMDLQGGRILLERSDGVLPSLFFHGLFDDVLTWALSSSGGFSIRPCSSLIVYGDGRTLRRCPFQMKLDLESLLEERWPADEEQCLRCWHSLPDRLHEDLQWNRREEEGGRVRFQLGVFALSRGDRVGARVHFHKLQEEACPEEVRAEVLLYRGILHLQEGQLQEAHSVLRDAAEEHPKWAAAYYHLGRCEFQWRDYIAASDLFRRALDLGVPPEMEDDIRLYLGICHVQLEEFDEALEALEGIRRITSSVLFFQAASLLGKGRLQEALRGFQEALDRGPDPEDLSSIHFYLGHCLKELEQWEEAVRHLEEALEADPRSYEAWNLLGYCRFRLGCHHEAIQAFLKALEIRPRSAVDLANIGRNLWELGDLEGARRWYQRALALDPTLVFAKEHLARIKRQKNGGPDS